MAGYNYVYNNNDPIVSDCSRVGALTAGCSIIHCCLPAQLERNADMMTHNWFFKALPLILAGPGGSLRWEKICIYMDTVITTHKHACRHAHTNGFESDGPMNGLGGKRKSDRRSPSMQCATATWW